MEKRRGEEGEEEKVGEDEDGEEEEEAEEEGELRAAAYHKEGEAAWSQAANAFALLEKARKTKDDVKTVWEESVRDEHRAKMGLDEAIAEVGSSTLISVVDKAGRLAPSDPQLDICCAAQPLC